MSSDQGWKRNKPSPLNSEVRVRLVNRDGVTTCGWGLPEDECASSHRHLCTCRAQPDAWHMKALKERCRVDAQIKDTPLPKGVEMQLQALQRKGLTTKWGPVAAPSVEGAGGSWQVQKC